MIGKREPARDHGTIAIAGTRAMYSSARGTRPASVSATPYIPTVKSAVAARNHTTPVALAVAAFTVSRGRIAAIDVIVDPDKLGGLALGR